MYILLFTESCFGIHNGLQESNVKKKVNLKRFCSHPLALDKTLLLFFLPHCQVLTDESTMLYAVV